MYNFIVILALVSSLLLLSASETGFLDERTEQILWEVWHEAMTCRVQIYSVGTSINATLVHDHGESCEILVFLNRNERLFVCIHSERL